MFSKVDRPFCIPTSSGWRFLLGLGVLFFIMSVYLLYLKQHFLLVVARKSQTVTLLGVGSSSTSDSSLYGLLWTGWEKEQSPASGDLRLCGPTVAVRRDFGYDWKHQTTPVQVTWLLTSAGVGWASPSGELAPPSSTSWSSPDPRPHPAAGGKSRTEETAPWSQPASAPEGAIRSFREARKEAASPGMARLLPCLGLALPPSIKAEGRTFLNQTCKCPPDT